MKIDKKLPAVSNNVTIIERLINNETYVLVKLRFYIGGMVNVLSYTPHIA